jgi:hypothetical protein
VRAQSSIGNYVITVTRHDFAGLALILAESGKNCEFPVASGGVTSAPNVIKVFTNVT